MSESPVVIIFDSNGNEIYIPANSSISGARGSYILGSDGTVGRFLTVDTSGRSVVVGAGTAGTPNGGVVSIQGISGGTSVSTTVTNAFALDSTLTGGTVKSIVRSGTKGISTPSDITSVAVDANTQALHVALTGASTVTANIGTTNGLALDTTLTGGTQKTKITDGTNNITLINTTPAGTEYSIPVRNIPSGTQTISGAVTANAGTGSFIVAQSTAANLNATITGTVTSNIGTTNGLALDSTLTGGTAKSIIRSGAKGTSTSSDVTSVAVDANTQALHVALTGASTVTANIGTTNGLALDSTLIGGTQKTKITDGTNTVAISSTSPVGNEQGLITRNIPSGTQTVSGTVTANAGTGSFTVSQATASNLNANVSGTVTANIGTTNGLALDATLTSGTQRTKITDGTNNAALASTSPVGTEQGLIVRNIPSGTQIISGTVTSNIGTTNGLALDSTLTAGSAKSILRSGTKGTSTPSDITSASVDANTQALHVALTGSSTVTANIGTTNGLALDTTLTGGTQRTKITDGTNNVALSSTNPTGSEQGLITRNIPSGTQTVSGTVTSNIGTTNGLALDTTLTGGTAKSIIRSGAKGISTSADITSVAVDANTQALHVALTGSSTVTSNIGTTNGLALDTTLTGGSAKSIIRSGAKGTSTSADVTSVAVDANTQALHVSLTGSSTVTANIGTTNGLALDSTLTNGNLKAKVTDGTNNITVKPASTAAVATDTALVVAISPNNPLTIGVADTVAIGTLNALNAAVSVSLAGNNSAGTQIDAGTLIGTIVPELSFDGGTTWVSTFFDDPSTGSKSSNIVYSSANTVTSRTIITGGGASNVRIRVSAYTSGATTCDVRSSTTNDPSVLYSSAPNSIIPPTIAMSGGAVTATPPTYNNNTINALSLTTAGSLRVASKIIPGYGTSNQTVAITLASLASAAARSSAVVNNNSTLYEDVLLFFKLTTAASGVSTTGYVNIYGYGTVDGSTYPDGVVGTDSAVTLSAPPNLVLLAQINANVNSKTFTYGPVSFCRMYGLDRLPQKWGIVVVNLTNAAFNATVANFAVTYQGINGLLF